MAIVLDMKKLKEFEAKLKEEVTIKVGVLEKKNARPTDAKYDNAGIGKKHEFGLFSPEIGKRLPKRSFLMMPLKTRYMSTLESKKWASKEDFEKILDPVEGIKFFRKFGELATRIIDDAFKTGGFGQWKPSDMSFKKVHQTLVETSQLRRSITYKVVKK
jgi:hypothetical protein